MYSIIMQCSLSRLFLMIGGNETPDDCGCTGFTVSGDCQGNLFCGAGNEGPLFWETVKTDIPVIIGLYSNYRVDISVLPPDARRLFELSANAFDAVIGAWLSELPITEEIIRFGRKILAAAGIAAHAGRRAAEAAATDRGDPDVRAVLDAAYKVWHEIHRLMGLLRFNPDEAGVYIARCGPDHFILPALGPHFKERFGRQPWAIIDEKRRLCMRCSNESLEVHKMGGSALSNNPQGGEWENLWRHYHKTINNESRNNPDLQRRFMPQRYWKYLTEL